MWFHICEMLEPNAFEEWCGILSEDEHTKVQNGTITYRKEIFPPYACMKKASPRPWEYGGYGMQANQLDYEEHLCNLRYMYEGNCALKIQYGDRKKAITKIRFPFLEVAIYANGPAALFRQAARYPYLEVMEHMLRKRVHYGVVDERGIHAYIHAVLAHRTASTRLLVQHRAEFSYFCVIVPENWATSRALFEEAASREQLALSTAQYQIMRTKPYGILEKASSGTLECAPEADLNFSDPASGMTPLMFAAAAGKVNMVRELIAQRVDIHAESVEGATALTFATENARGIPAEECMELLISARADVNHRSGKNYMGRYLWDFCGRGEPLGSSVAYLCEHRKMDLLIKSGYDVNLQNDYGIPAVFSAAAASDLDMVLKLVDAKSGFLDLCFDAPDCRPGEREGWTLFDHPTNGTGWDPCFTSLYFNCNHGFMKYCLDRVNVNEHKIWHPIGGILSFFFILELDYPMLRDGEANCLKLFYERKFDVNQKFNSVGLRPSWWHVTLCSAPCAFMMLFDQKADLEVKDGPFGLFGNFVDFSTKVGNQVALDSYADWIQMQADEAPQ